jgi:hypothetical protein
MDDAEFTRTRNYTDTVELLRLLHNSLSLTVESLERFHNEEAQYFQANQNALRMTWDRYFAVIEKDCNELRFLRTVLQHKIDAFDNKKNGVSTPALS